MTDKAVDGGQTLWQVEELQLSNQTSTDNGTREEEEREIKEDWMRKKGTASNREEKMVEGTLSFLEKYFELQVRELVHPQALASQPHLFNCV